MLREGEKGDELEYEVMSLNIENKLREIAKERCRELRKNQTSSEEILWKVIRNRSFFGKKFYRQYPLFFDYLGKETFYIADFYCHEEKLVIEIDGKIHEKQKRKDKLRTDVINTLGIEVMRFKSEDLENKLDEVLMRLKKEINVCHISKEEFYPVK